MTNDGDALSHDAAIRNNAKAFPDQPAYIEPGGSLSWAAYDQLIDLLASDLRSRGLDEGDRVGVWLPDGIGVHVAYAACVRAGLVAAGIAGRSGEAEVKHVLQKSRCKALITEPTGRSGDLREAFERLATEVTELKTHLVLTGIAGPLETDVVSAMEALRLYGDPSFELREFPTRGVAQKELLFINSTSGTTGLPKCVTHDEYRWHKFHEYAVDAADLTGEDVIMSVVPAPYGFGLWSAHYTPTFLATPCVVMPGFDVEKTIEMLQRHRVTVLMAVATQFIMLLGHPKFQEADLSSLRVLFTGGESIPPERAKQFEDQTGCKVLNFYGSNEAGALSYTKITDPQERRIHTSGKTIPEVHVRLFDEAGRELPESAQVGVPANRGDICSLGYLDDPAGNAELYTTDGWVLMGDLVEIDPEGYLRVVGRTSDLIIRGGKNISAPAVEAEVATHPAVLGCAAVGLKDDVFGERVCICIALKKGHTLEFADLLQHLRSRDVSIDWWPERMVILDEIPMSAGGKIAKSDLRKMVNADSGTLRILHAPKLPKLTALPDENFRPTSGREHDSRLD